jgi:hypothetical protein
VTGRETIHLRRLDDVATELGVADRLDFISMDIDGHEPAFFVGGKETLTRRHPPIAKECAQRCLYHAGTDVRGFATLVQSMGYTLCDETTRRPWPSEFAFLQACGNYTSDANVLALPTLTL